MAPLGPGEDGDTRRNLHDCGSLCKYISRAEPNPARSSPVFRLDGLSAGVADITELLQPLHYHLLRLPRVPSTAMTPPHMSHCTTKCLSEPVPPPRYHGSSRSSDGSTLCNHIGRPLTYSSTYGLRTGDETPNARATSIHTTPPHLISLIFSSRLERAQNITHIFLLLLRTERTALSSEPPGQDMSARGLRAIVVARSRCGSR
ncbi:hypothetical protein GY45DRAFT_1330279 [Cubamyces sp. BRFM 1775]|nr:hypothetical protein GY45DRAFT_1330279 [Cubamyces sp. BRFM 1775]